MHGLVTQISHSCIAHQMDRKNIAAGIVGVVITFIGRLVDSHYLCYLSCIRFLILRT
jgi:hypothetical protein